MIMSWWWEISHCLRVGGKQSDTDSSYGSSISTMRQQRVSQDKPAVNVWPPVVMAPSAGSPNAVPLWVPALRPVQPWGGRLARGRGARWVVDKLQRIDEHLPVTSRYSGLLKTGACWHVWAQTHKCTCVHAHTWDCALKTLIYTAHAYLGIQAQTLFTFHILYYTV